jgi:hypothetical protein
MPRHDRSALQLYVHCANSVHYLAELNASVPGVELYAERALLLADREDVVCVPDEIEPSYLAYLARLGIGPNPVNVLVASRFEGTAGVAPLWEKILRSDEALGLLSCLVQSHGAARLHPFIATAGPFSLARALAARAGLPVDVAGGAPSVVAYADFKHHVRARAVELGIPVADGEVVDLTGAGGHRRQQEGMLRRAMERQMRRTGRVIVRGSSGAAGSSTFTVEQDGQIPELAEYAAARRENSIYLVESMVEVTVSPNVQMHISPDGRATRCGGVTDQRWDRPLVHGGNRFPSSAHCLVDMLRWARTLAEWLGGLGFAGLAGFDFVEYNDEHGKPRAFLAEVNPRTNGASYPLRLMRRLNVSQREAGSPAITAFTSGTIKTEAETFDELEDIWGDAVFSPERGSGLIPYVTGQLRHGKCSVVALAATREEADELYQEAGATTAAF